ARGRGRPRHTLRFLSTRTRASAPHKDDPTFAKGRRKVGHPAAEEQNQDPSARVSHPGESGWEPSLAQDDSFLLHLPLLVTPSSKTAKTRAPNSRKTHIC